MKFVNGRKITGLGVVLAVASLLAMGVLTAGTTLGQETDVATDVGDASDDGGGEVTITGGEGSAAPPASLPDVG